MRYTNDDFKLIIYSNHVPTNQHRGRYNSPIVNEVAVQLVDKDKGPRVIILHCRDNKTKRVSELHCSYDLLQYPLTFPIGQNGYYVTIQESHINKYVFCSTQYYADMDL